VRLIGVWSTGPRCHSPPHQYGAGLTHIDPITTLESSTVALSRGGETPETGKAPRWPVARWHWSTDPEETALPGLPVEFEA